MKSGCLAGRQLGPESHMMGTRNKRLLLHESFDVIAKILELFAVADAG